MKISNEDSEADLIRQIAKGDTSLFRLLVDKYKDVSFSLACSILKNDSEAQDALQDAFFKAFKGLNKFSFKSSFSTWLYRIVVNTCYNALERQKVRQTSSIEDHASSVTTEGTGFDQLREKERTVIINQVLSTMKPNEALLLRLYYLGEQNINEIAAITDMTVSSIKVTLHRARKSFHDDLERLIGNEKDHLL